jgi:hypothetical protein
MGKGLYRQARALKYAAGTYAGNGLPRARVHTGSAPTPWDASTAAGQVLAGGGIVPAWLMAAAMQGACTQCQGMAGTAAGTAQCSMAECSHA